MQVEVVDAKLGPVVRIDEQAPRRLPRTANKSIAMEMPSALSGGSSLLPGMIEVTATVFATFAIE